MYSEIQKFLIVFLVSTIKPVFNVSNIIRRDLNNLQRVVPEILVPHINSTNLNSDLTVRTFSSRIINILLKHTVPIPSNHFNINRRTVKRSVSSSSNPMSSATLKKFKTMDFSEKAVHQFCGETLFYAVEYYCVYVKGTGVYTPDYEFDSTYVMGEEESTGQEVDRRDATHLNGTFLFIIFNCFFLYL